VIQHHYPSVSHDPSEILLICWFATQETYVFIIINAVNICAAKIFCENRDTFFFLHDKDSSIW